jgi:hypothetical protein
LIDLSLVRPAKGDAPSVGLILGVTEPVDAAWADDDPRHGRFV